MKEERIMSIRRACEVLGYSKQAYYQREKRTCVQTAQKETTQATVLEKVGEIRQEMPRLGTRKLYHLLAEDFEQSGLKVGRDKLFSLLRASNLLIMRRKKYIRTTDSSQWRREHENLVTDFVAQKPEQLLVADITYFDTEQGTVYGHLITDGYSKKIMGYKVAYDMKKERTIEAFNQAMKNRIYTHEGIHHSDRGSQYCSSVYTTNAQNNNYSISMTQDGSPYDNAVAERVNGILKDEFGLGEKMKNLTDVRSRLERAVDIYNNKRPHWSCHLLTPNQMHQQDVLPIVTWASEKKKQSIQNIITNVC
jgi:putative transposase